MKRMVSRAVRALGVLLNFAMLTVIIPTLLYALLEYIYLGRPKFQAEAAAYGVFTGAVTLVFWNMFVWEHTIKIRNSWALFLVRTIKAAWVFAVWVWFTMSSNFDMPFRTPIFLASILSGALVYAGLRHFFAPRYRI